MQGRQVFQSSSNTRWQRVKWGSRILGLLAIIGLFVLVIAYVSAYTPSIPRIHSIVYKQTIVDSENLLNKNNNLIKKYGGFRKYINDKDLRMKQYTLSPSARQENFSPKKFPANFQAGIRSAFYVSWDPQSFFSLQRNITKLNLIIPEWMFINPFADTLYTSVDARAFAVMKQSGVHIMPVLSNVYKDAFQGEALHRIINDKTKRERLINDVINILQKNNFIGVNVDFEDLKEKTDEHLISFQKELYDKLHAKGFLVTQDVMPFNDDYNYSELSKYNDYIFVMAYDEFSQDTKPGPIADQKWIEAAIGEAIKKVPPQKLILAVAAFGYDWANNQETNPLTYQQALITARESNALIDYDNDSYNLKYSYTDDGNVPHTVFFTDAASAFNSLRFAHESNLAGVALWRLGSEDYRMWSFYNMDMSKASLQHFDFNKMTFVTSTDDVDWMGNGEIIDIRSTPRSGHITPEIDSSDLLISEETYDSLPSMFVAQKYSWNGADTTRNRKKIVLTFDDGPDPDWTPKILDILSREHVPATFFIIGLNAENNIPIVKRIYREGHEIGDHTFTHPNIAEVSKNRALLEIESTRLLTECITGHSTILFRAPYNADYDPEKMEELLPLAIARTQNFLDVGESIDPLDWEPGVTADSIFARVVQRKKDINAQDEGGNIILLHDAGGETREETVKALPRIIAYFKKQGYTFTTIADLLGKKKDDLMPPVPHGSGYYLIQFSSFIAELGYWGGQFLFSLFIVFIILSMIRIICMAVLAIRARKAEKKEAPFPLLSQYPLVSVIVPAYNEEVNAVSSLQNLLHADYPNFEIIFVDDGSKDATFEKVNAAFAGNSQVKVLTKTNGGKASALNLGIREAKGNFVVCIDADTKLKTDAVSQLIKHFLNDHENRVGAVAGNVKVGNEVNLLTKWQAIEYITSQNFDRRAFSSINAITVVPGAIGAFRKEAIEDAGGFTTDTLAEDCDLTIRIIRLGYQVMNENNALAYTEAPQHLKQFFKQRFRWSFGVLQTFWKHKEVLFNKKFPSLGFAAMPNILLFQYVIPSIIPLADFFMLIGLLTGNAGKIIGYYLVFMAFDAAISIAAFLMEKERLSRLIWLIPQRIIYRWLMWLVLFKAVRRAVKGELQNWGVLKRTGNVREIQPV